MHGEPAFEKLAPAVFRHLVERCLAKDPAKRWQTASDLKLFKYEKIKRPLYPFDPDMRLGRNE